MYLPLYRNHNRYRRLPFTTTTNKQTKRQSIENKNETNMAQMAEETTKRKITIDGVSRIEDVLPYAHLPDVETLNARQEYLRSLLYQESETTLRHMYSCIYNEPIPSNKFQIVTEMFTTLKRARNEITLLKKRRAEIDALNKTNTVVLNVNNNVVNNKK